MRAVAAFLVLALALAGCSRRERANPFDPRNPVTGGGPAGFVALAGNGHVDLKWNPVTSLGFSGFHLYRKTAAETTFRLLTGTLPAASTGYSDYGLLNGLDHSYRLVFVFSPEGERGQPASDIATPGPARPWVADESGSLDRVTPDGRHVAYARTTDLQGPTTVAADSANGVVWTSESFSGNVRVLNPGSGALVSIPGFVTPSALAVDPLRRSAWVCDEGRGSVAQFDLSGATLGPPIETLQMPTGIAIDPSDRSIWVVDRGADQVLHYASDQALLSTTPIHLPSRVAVDSVTQRPWVTSFMTKRVYRLSPSGALEDSVALQGPIGLAIDAHRGVVWIADAIANQVVALDRGGTRLFAVDGLSETRDVSVDPETGEAWAVAPGTGEVVRLSPAGAILRRLGGFGRPLGVSVDPGIH